MRERDVELYLANAVKAMGGECRKVKWIGRAGAPDRLVMLPPRAGGQFARTLWVELKAPGEKAKPHQAREHNRMKAMGQCVVVVDSFERVDEVLR